MSRQHLAINPEDSFHENLTKVVLTDYSKQQLYEVRKILLEQIAHLQFIATPEELPKLAVNLASFQGQLLVIEGLLQSKLTISVDTNDILEAAEKTE